MQQIICSGSSAPFGSSNHCPAGTTMASPARAVAWASPIRAVATPDNTTDTSSRVSECGVAGVPGASSTRHTAVSVAPVVGVTSDVKRVSPGSWVGSAGA